MRMVKSQTKLLVFMLQMAQMIDMLGAKDGKDYNMAAQMADGINASLDSQEASGGGAEMPDMNLGEPSITAKARERASEATAPR